ncbi:hypothetical protein [Nitritalea halalkaliphila]|uniref:hypothetical protein n=1 Tax=Nitritalea halalkaliphila TaxID=590849 RepID=UPI0002D3DFC1|nr:hypothetical protein [Nitritalea halalkaliphila]
MLAHPSLNRAETALIENAYIHYKHYVGDINDRFHDVSRPTLKNGERLSCLGLKPPGLPKIRRYAARLRISASY